MITRIARTMTVALRVSSQLRARINRAAEEDSRKQPDEFHYLITQGLAVRNRLEPDLAAMKLPRDTSLTLRVSPHLFAQIDEAAAEDSRKRTDEINYLLILGLSVREQHKANEERVLREYAEVGT